MIFHPRKWLDPHLVDFLDEARFELAALCHRLLSARKREDPCGKHFLQLGCYDCLPPAFLNTDFPYNKSAELHLDLRYPLPFVDNTWRGIYAHHVVEHIKFPDALQLFRECHRTLAPGGVFRMIVPDTEKFILPCAETDPEKRRAIFDLYPPHIMAQLDVRTPLEMLNYIFRDDKFNRHHFAWDWETAELRLRDAGFTQVIRQGANQSLVPEMGALDKPHWACFSLYIDAVK